MMITPKEPEKMAMPQRIAKLTGRETIRGIPMRGICDMILRHGGQSELKRLCGEAGIVDIDFNPLKNYPLKQFLTLEHATAQFLAPVLGGFDNAVYQLGAAAVSPFFDTVAGQTMRLLARHEPHRLLSAVPNGYSLLLSAGRFEYFKTAQSEGTFYFSDDVLGPVHNSGVFDTGLKAVCDIRAKISLEQRGPLDYRFFLSW